MSRINTKTMILILTLVSLLSILVSAIILYPTGLPTGSTSAFLPVFFRLGAAAAVAVLSYSFFVKKSKYAKVFVLFLIFLALICQLVFLLTFARPVYTDTGYVMTMAGRLVDGVHEWYQYFYIYPNNVNVVIWWSLLFKPLSLIGITNYFGIYPWIQMLMLDLGIFYLHRSLKKINDQTSNIFLLVTLFYAPIFFYAIFPYNDVVAVSLIMVVIGSFIRFQMALRGKNQIVQGLIMMLALALAVSIRQNSIIILIALLATIIFTKSFSKKAKTLLVLGGVLFTLFGTLGFNQLQKNAGFISKPDLVTPSVRYVNMSWNPNTHGQIDGPDSFLYSGLPKKERTEKINAELKHRIKILGVKGSVIHLWKKIAFMFSLGLSNQDMGGLQVKPPLLKYEWQAGELTEFLGNIFQPFYILVLSVSSFFIFYVLKNREKLDSFVFNTVIFSSYSIVGVFTFHILFWEVRDRYAMPMFPFLLLLAAMGIKLLSDKSQESVNLPHVKLISWKTISVLSGILLLLSMITSYSHSQQPTGRGGAVYTSGFSMYTEGQKELANIKAHSRYQTDSFELASPANTLYLNFSKLSKAEAKDLSVKLINKTTGSIKNLKVENKEMAYLDSYKPGKYQLLIVNNGNFKLQTPILQQVETKNIQGPQVSENGRVTTGLNAIFSFADNVRTKWITLSVFILLHAFFLIALIFGVLRINNYKKRQ
ncbi:hypothetical protein [Fructobacillus parabroussonetiae]|uniref:Glycosyltransferase RgtA/B/C/D-like domain-containing protein n=1 Tax=Fructobacillus parabroussonetiae TaxID=2713174 RepID=A0ABS5QX13_9LACO|nr:hypothetical protein [Fructobacillus parabroussonetiae]MBS9337738.1 hypothetical protein [Fructobacillus parabroussonetiae]